jgi:FPC/CPF motif-containing protein YcgG
MFKKEKLIMYEILNLQEARKQEAWKKVVFDEFYTTMINENEKFPCVFGTAGVKSQQVRYYFSNSQAEEPNTHALATVLEEYVKNSRTYGNNTSLVVFFKPSSTTNSLQNYEQYFWAILKELSLTDSSSWPAEIPEDPDHHLWEFSFSGEPIFVVCNNPAHKLRRSRYSSTFMITFQPRWVFDFLQTPAGQKSKRIVREILKSYDDIEVHPELGAYGDKNNKEWLQYYLSDSNEINRKKCPFQFKEKQDD